MRAWGNSLLDAGSFVPMDAKNPGTYMDTLYVDDKIAGSQATVPASSPYMRVLDFVPLRGSLSVVVDSEAVTVREWGNPPVTAGEVSVNFVTGEILFHADDAGLDVSCEYYHSGTVIDANWWNAMQQAVDAASTGPIDPSRLPGKWLQELGNLTMGGFGFPAFDDVGSLSGFRQIVGTPNRITVANDEGNAGNPTIDVGPSIARRDVANTFAAAQTMNLGVIIKGLTLPPTQLYANSADVNHTIVATDVVLAMGNNSASYTINVSMPVPAAGRTLLVINAGPLSNAPVFTATGGALFTWAGGGFVATYNGPTTDHAAYLIYAETTMRWRVFPLT